MSYVALLRGINVGGNNKVAMTELKTAFEALGFEDVRTYINSGNVIFKTPDGEDLPTKIEAAIETTFGFRVAVVVRSLESIVAICNKTPEAWKNDDMQRTDVMFLWPEVANKEVLTKLVINPKLENVLYVDGALVWNIARENVLRGNGIKLIKTDLYKHMTIRNINTVRKLRELMQG